MIVWCRRRGLGRRGRLGLGGWGCWLLRGRGGGFRGFMLLLMGWRMWGSEGGVDGMV